MQEKKLTKYTALYMCLGISVGMCLGAAYGLLFSDDLSHGLSMGVLIGLCLGIAIGAAKDKRLSENKMEICRVESAADSSDSIVYAKDKSGTEKQFRVTEKEMREQEFSVGDWVAEETKGKLISLKEK